MPIVPPHRKLLSREEMLERHGPGRKHRLVFTNGCFDLLHRGHVEYLHAARSFGEALVVGLNSDASVRRLKGEARPLVGEEDRAVVLGGLAAVDAVVLFGEDTPLELIRALRPDVLVKGGDYEESTVVGAEEVRRYGGEIRIVPLVEGRSTTTILQRGRSR